MPRYLSLGPPVVVWVVLAAASGAAIEPRLEKGTVVSASGGTLVIKDKAGKQQTFAVDAATKITVNGKPGKLDDLQETMLVQVTTDEKDKVLAVSTIDREKSRVWLARAVAAPSLTARPGGD
jgi:hypothetical protein